MGGTLAPESCRNVGAARGDARTSAADSINQCERLARLGVATPGDVAIGPHQHQLTFIKGRGFAMFDSVYLERNTPARGCALDEFGRHIRKFQKHETIAEQIED